MEGELGTRMRSKVSEEGVTCKWDVGLREGI